MSAKPWITPAEAEKVAKRVAEDVVKEIQPGGSEVIPNPTLEGDEPELEGLEINGDKFKIPAGGSDPSITVDSEFLLDSENPVQNKILAEKALCLDDQVRMTLEWDAENEGFLLDTGDLPYLILDLVDNDLIGDTSFKEFTQVYLELDPSLPWNPQGEDQSVELQGRCAVSFTNGEPTGLELHLINGGQLNAQVDEWDPETPSLSVHNISTENFISPLTMNPQVPEGALVTPVNVIYYRNRFFSVGGNTPRNTIEFFIPDDWDGDFVELLQSQDQELLSNLITDSLDGIAAGLSVPVVCFDQLGNRYEFTATGESNLDFRIEPNQATASIGDYGYDTFALICGSISIELNAETGDGRIFVTINEKTRYATALYVHNLYFYSNVGGSNQWFCLQYKSTSSKRNVQQPTFASELCDLFLNNDNTHYIWHQWHEHDAHLYNATVQINEDPAPSIIKAEDELTVTGALASGANSLEIGYTENGEGKTVTVSNIDSQHEVYEMIQPAYIRPLGADNYWPYE